MKRHIRRAALGLGLAVLFSLLALWRTQYFFAAVEANPPDPAAIRFELDCIVASLVAFLVTLIIAVVVWRTGIRLEQVDSATVKIFGVCDAFVMAMTVHLAHRVSQPMNADLASAITTTPGILSGPDAPATPIRELGSAPN
ncbi:MAG: hypothetical protein FJ271_22345 [Planctomycetes bacterium]|nr:hypothetical protein [Planctomycetota bacterium]